MPTLQRRARGSRQAGAPAQQVAIPPAARLSERRAPFGREAPYRPPSAKNGRERDVVVANVPSAEFTREESRRVLDPVTGGRLTAPLPRGYRRSTDAVFRRLPGGTKEGRRVEVVCYKTIGVLEALPPLALLVARVAPGRALPPRTVPDCERRDVRCDGERGPGAPPAVLHVRPGAAQRLRCTRHALPWLLPRDAVPAVQRWRRPRRTSPVVLRPARGSRPAPAATADLVSRSLPRPDHERRCRIIHPKIPRRVRLHLPRQRDKVGAASVSLPPIDRPCSEQQARAVIAGIADETPVREPRPLAVLAGRCRSITPPSMLGPCQVRARSIEAAAARRSRRDPCSLSGFRRAAGHATMGEPPPNGAPARAMSNERGIE